MRTFIFAALCLGAALGVAVTSPDATAGMATVGQAAPNFTLTGADGKTHSLSDYAGKFVVLEWTNPNCPFVHKFYDSGTMQKLQKDETGKGRGLAADQFLRAWPRRLPDAVRSGVLREG